METDYSNGFVLKNFDLIERKLLPKEKNQVFNVSIMAPDLLKTAHLPVAEIRQLPNEKLPVHLINDQTLQRFIEVFHRYGPVFGTNETFCPFQAGGTIERFKSLLGENNVFTEYEETSKLHRSKFSAFFSEEKLESFKVSFKNIAKMWLEIEVKLQDVFLFESVQNLVSRSLIHGMLGYENCSQEDVVLNATYWKDLLTPLETKIKNVDEFKKEETAGFLKEMWNVFQDGCEKTEKRYISSVTAEDLGSLVKRIYEGTINKESSFCHYLSKNEFSEKEILSNVKSFLFAGQEKVGYLLGFILYEYAKNKNLQNNLQINSKDIKNLYVEALRFYSVAGVKREARSDMVLSYPDADGKTHEHFIRKGDRIVALPYVTGRSLEWDDKDTFNPDRKNLYNVKKTAHFGSGMNACIAEDFAETMILTLLEAILPNVSLECAKELPKIYNTYTMRPKDDIEVKFSAKG